MKKYGYMRKKLNVLSFILGICLVLMMWLYSASFMSVGTVNGEKIYSYQLRAYHKQHRYEDVVEMTAENEYEEAKEENESLEEFKERFSNNADFIIYGY